MEEEHAAAATLPPPPNLFRRLRSYWPLAGGQVLSDLGSSLTLFALDVWIYERTKSVTLFASVHLFSALPIILLAPFAGTWIDRLNRRRVMIACNLGLATLTLLLASLAVTGKLSTAAICVVAPLFATLGAFLSLSFAAASSQLVPPDHYARVYGIVATVKAVGAVAVPFTASLLVLKFRLHGVLLIDFATTIVAVATACATPLADPPPLERSGAGASVVRDTVEGWRFVKERPGLFGMLGLFTAREFVARMSTLLATPLVLSVASAAALGVVRSAAVAGVMCGSLFLGIFGGRLKSKMHAVLWTCVLNGACLLFAGANVSIVGLAIFVFAYGICEPIIASLSGAIWQAKVPTEMLGRAYAVRQAVLSAVFPVVVLVAGPLSDRVFEPAMRSDGWLAPTLGRVLGTGPGRGIGFLLMCLGVTQVIAAFVAARNPRVRNVETELPDAP